MRHQAGDDRARRARYWIARWGFSATVVVAAAIAAYVGLTVDIPTEMGIAFFAFVEFSTGGVRAGSLTDLPRTLAKQEGVLNVLLDLVDEPGGSSDAWNGK